MKRLLRGFLALAVVFSLAPAAWANVAATSEVGSSSTPIKTVVVTSDTDSAGNFGPNDYIIGFKLVATTATAGCDLIDAATMTSGTDSNSIDELRTNVVDTVALQIWPNPYKLTTDLSINVTDGTCIVYYR